MLLHQLHLSSEGSRKDGKKDQQWSHDYAKDDNHQLQVEMEVSACHGVENLAVQPYWLKSMEPVVVISLLASIAEIVVAENTF